MYVKISTISPSIATTKFIINTIKAGRYLSFENIFQPFFQIQRRIYQFILQLFLL